MLTSNRKNSAEKEYIDTQDFQALFKRRDEMREEETLPYIKEDLKPEIKGKEILLTEQYRKKMALYKLHKE